MAATINNPQKILAVILLVAVVAVIASTMAENAHSLITSIGWHDLASVGWVTAPI